jgi:hypothetical protein
VVNNVLDAARQWQPSDFYPPSSVGEYKFGGERAGDMTGLIPAERADLITNSGLAEAGVADAGVSGGH